MCAVSAIGDNYVNQFPSRPYYPQVHPYLNQYVGSQQISQQLSLVSRAEFDALKRDMEELKKLFLAAKKYDEATGQPDCEVESKVGLIKRLADLVGVSMDDVFGTKP